MISVHLPFDLQSQDDIEFFKVLFTDCVSIYQDQELTIEIAHCFIPKACFGHKTDIITISVELIESMYAFTMATWLFYHNYMAKRKLNELQFGTIENDETYKMILGYYQWATMKYSCGHKTKMSFSSIIKTPVVNSIMSKIMAFIVGHEFAHKIYPNRGDPNSELQCDNASLDNIVRVFRKNLSPVLFGSCVFILYTTSKQVIENIAYTGDHPDAWIRLEQLSERFKQISESRFRVMLRSLCNMFLSVKYPSKNDSLYSYVNCILILIIYIDYPEVLRNWKSEYRTHEDLARDLFKKLSDFKKNFI